MLAVDTNLVVRFITRDDEIQSPKARHIIESGDVIVLTTVLLETDWVLRRLYKFLPGEVAAAVRGLSGLPGVSLEDPLRIAQALDWFEKGMDFADALHLAGAQDCEAFVSFDQDLAKTAKACGAPAVRHP